MSVETGGLVVIDAEEGDTSEWDSIEVGGSNTFIAQGAAANNGSYGFRCLYLGTDDKVFAENILPSAQVDCYYRFYVYFPTGAYPYVGEGAYVDWYLAQLWDETAGEYTARLEVESNSTNVRLRRFRYRHNSGTTAIDITGNVLSPNTWYRLELHVKNANGTGEAELWLGDASIASASSLTNDNYDSERLNLGSMFGSGTPANGEYFYLDDIKADTSPVGAYSVGGIVVLRRRRM